MSKARAVNHDTDYEKYIKDVQDKFETFSIEKKNKILTEIIGGAYTISKYATERTEVALETFNARTQDFHDMVDFYGLKVSDASVKGGMTVAHCAAKNGFDSVLCRDEITAEMLNETSSEGVTPIVYAVFSGGDRRILRSPDIACVNPDFERTVALVVYKGANVDINVFRDPARDLRYAMSKIYPSDGGEASTVDDAIKVGLVARFIKENAGVEFDQAACNTYIQQSFPEHALDTNLDQIKQKAIELRESFPRILAEAMTGLDNNKRTEAASEAFMRLSNTTNSNDVGTVLASYLTPKDGKNLSAVSKEVASSATFVGALNARRSAARNVRAEESKQITM